MAPITDSQFTDPSALRELYRNPRNPLSRLDDGDSSISNSILAGILQSSGGGSGNIVQQPQGCPAVGEYTIALVPGTERDKMPVAVQLLQKGHHQLWNPLTQSFKTVVAANILKDQECVKVRTVDGAESIVSLSDLLIQTFEDETGRMIMDFLKEQDISHHAVSVLDFKPVQSEIASISSVGKRDVVHISLEGEGIYASGTTPTKLTLRHNKPQTGGGGDNGPIEPPF